MGIRWVKRKAFFCDMCGFEWFARGRASNARELPNKCPNCKTMKWNSGAVYGEGKGNWKKDGERKPSGKPPITFHSRVDNEQREAESEAQGVSESENRVTRHVTEETPSESVKTAENGYLVEPIRTVIESYD
jgi:hypothetical protein